MRPIATDTHDFPKLRSKGCVYVDKTMSMRQLAADPNANIFFISRTRRFGKSLTVSALKALFSARRELFEGLAIDKTDWKWERCPIMHFEFNDLTTSSVEAFEKNLEDHVRERLDEAGYACDSSLSAHENFAKAEAVRSGSSASRSTPRRATSSIARRRSFDGEPDWIMLRFMLFKMGKER